MWRRAYVFQTIVDNCDLELPKPPSGTAYSVRITNNSLYIVRNEKNDTGIHIIDERHRAIVSLINSLFFFTQENFAEVALTPTLTVLSQYSKHSVVLDGLPTSARTHP